MDLLHGHTRFRTPVYNYLYVHMYVFVEKKVMGLWSYALWSSPSVRFKFLDAQPSPPVLSSRSVPPFLALHSGSLVLGLVARLI